MDVLLNAGGSSGHMVNVMDDRSTGLTINRMELGIFVSLATLQYAWELNVPYYLVPLGMLLLKLHISYLYFYYFSMTFSLPCWDFRFFIIFINLKTMFNVGHFNKIFGTFILFKLQSA